MCMLGWMPDFPDPDNYLFTFFSGATDQWAKGVPDQALYDLLVRGPLRAGPGRAC